MTSLQRDTPHESTAVARHIEMGDRLSCQLMAHSTGRFTISFDTIDGYSMHHVTWDGLVDLAAGLNDFLRGVDRSDAG